MYIYICVCQLGSEEPAFFITVKKEVCNFFVCLFLSVSLSYIHRRFIIQRGHMHTRRGN